MIRTQIYIPETLHQTAKAIAGKRKESLAELLRNIIERGITEEKKEMKQKPLSNIAKLNIKGGPKDLSQNLDKYLYEER